MSVNKVVSGRAGMPAVGGTPTLGGRTVTVGSPGSPASLPPGTGVKGLRAKFENPDAQTEKPGLKRSPQAGEKPQSKIPEISKWAESLSASRGQLYLHLKAQVCEHLGSRDENAGRKLIMDVLVHALATAKIQQSALAEIFAGVGGEELAEFIKAQGAGPHLQVNLNRVLNAAKECLRNRRDKASQDLSLAMNGQLRFRDAAALRHLQEECRQLRIPSRETLDLVAVLAPGAQEALSPEHAYYLMMKKAYAPCGPSEKRSGSTRQNLQRAMVADALADALSNGWIHATDLQKIFSALPPKEIVAFLNAPRSAAGSRQNLHRVFDVAQACAHERSDAAGKAFMQELARTDGLSPDGYEYAKTVAAATSNLVLYQSLAGVTHRKNVATTTDALVGEIANVFITELDTAFASERIALSGFNEPELLQFQSDCERLGIGSAQDAMNQHLLDRTLTNVIRPEPGDYGIRNLSLGELRAMQPRLEKLEPSELHSAVAAQVTLRIGILSKAETAPGAQELRIAIDAFINGDIPTALANFIEALDKPQANARVLLTQTVMSLDVAKWRALHNALTGSDAQKNQMGKELIKAMNIASRRLQGTHQSLSARISGHSSLLAGLRAHLSNLLALEEEEAEVASSGKLSKDQKKEQKENKEKSEVERQRMILDALANEYGIRANVGNYLKAFVVRGPVSDEAERDVQQEIEDLMTDFDESEFRDSDTATRALWEVLEGTDYELFGTDNRPLIDRTDWITISPEEKGRRISGCVEELKRLCVEDPAQMKTLSLLIGGDAVMAETAMLSEGSPIYLASRNLVGRLEGSTKTEFHIREGAGGLVVRCNHEITDATFLPHTGGQPIPLFEGEASFEHAVSINRNAEVKLEYMLVDYTAQESAQDDRGAMEKAKEHFFASARELGRADDRRMAPLWSRQRELLKLEVQRLGLDRSAVDLYSDSTLYDLGKLESLGVDVSEFVDLNEREAELSGHRVEQLNSNVRRLIADASAEAKDARKDRVDAVIERVQQLEKNAAPPDSIGTGPRI